MRNVNDDPSKSDPWARRLAFLHFLITLPFLIFLLLQFRVVTEPLPFEPTNDPDKAIADAEAMKTHLDAHPKLTLFDDRWYFDWMYNSIVDPEKRAGMPLEERSRLLVEGYRSVFEDHRLFLHYFTLAALASMFFALLVLIRSGVLSALFLLFASLAMTPQMTLALIGRNLSHLTLYSVPHLLLALTILVLVIVGTASRRLEGKRKLQEAWTEIGLGSAGLVLGAGALAWIFASGTRYNLKPATGAGLLVFYGIYAIFKGIRAAIRAKRGETKAE